MGHPVDVDYAFRLVVDLFTRSRSVGYVCTVND